MKTDFKKVRNKDNSINLVHLYIQKYGNSTKKAVAYLESIEEMHPIHSRQVAAVAIATARFLP